MVIWSEESKQDLEDILYVNHVGKTQTTDFRSCYSGVMDKSNANFATFCSSGQK
jgi:hypothetical protein